MRVLAGDIGGTNARFVLYDGERAIDHAILESRRFTEASQAVLAFLKGRRARVACIGIAGPVIRGRCVATNLPWIIDENELASKTGIATVTLVNDLIAVGFGALASPSRAKKPLWGTKRPKGDATTCVLAPGTGLGECVLVHTRDGSFVPLATEGGHVDFAPRSPLERELEDYARRKLQITRVSYERFLSGPGIGLIYDFVRDTTETREPVRITKRIARASDRNAAITERGMNGESPVARRALEIFASIYGAEAGNLALKSLAAGGVLLCGNITNHILPLLMKSQFHASFLDKGRLRHVLETIPVAAVHAKELGLAGAHFLGRALARRR